MTILTTNHEDRIRLDSQVEALEASIDGDLLRPDRPHRHGNRAPGEDPTLTASAYEAARSLWNGMIDRRPGLIVRCKGVRDVQEAVRFAGSHGLLLAVRGGGHNVAGTASVENGVVIDLSEMNSVHVDPEERRVVAGGGARWADVDAATQAHGLATPGGVVSDTGIGGLTLGGGIGWLRRKYGLSCDNLVGAELVDAEGNVRRVDAETDSELLWGLRGGGGNFGVVTRFEYELHPVGPEVFVAFVLYHGDHTTQVLEAYRDYTSELADEVSSFAICGTVPDEEDFPEGHWGEPYVLLMACAATDPTRGEKLVRPLQEMGAPLADLSGPMPYVELQQILDADYPNGRRYYWKSLQLPALSDEVIDLSAHWATLKKRMDPDHLFRLHQNVPPAG